MNTVTFLVVAATFVVLTGYRHRRPRCSLALGGPAVDPERQVNSRVSADWVVVGSGVGGLCTVQALATRYSAREVLVTEVRDQVGGNITTIEMDGFLWEEGPNSFQPSDLVLTMAVDNGLKDDLVFGDPNAPRVVLWNGKTETSAFKTN